MSHCKVHHVNFYSAEPRAVYCMTIDRNRSKLALARSDGSIEIWNLANTPFIERFLPPNLQNFSIEGLSWCDDRLFSIGLHGQLVEYNIFSLCVKETQTVTGEAATCLDVNKSNTRLAVGTELGYLNLFEVTSEGAVFEKFLDKQEGRFICVKFDYTGEFLVTGSLNAIRVFNVSTGHAIHKMQLGRSETKKDTVVWCLEVLSDFTILSGDSRGILTIWDGKMGSQIESYQSHKADITALCIADEEDSIYCAGVDPLIVNYQKVKVGQTFKWVKSIQRKIHEHDVRAMVFFKNKLYSAGLDSYLACSYHPPKTLIKFAPILQNPCVQVAQKARLMLLRYCRHIEVWSLGETEHTESSYRGPVGLKTTPKKLLAIQKVGKNWAEEDEGEGILCTNISADGQWILLGTSTGFRLYSFQMIENKPNLTKLDDLDDNNIPCVQAAFDDKHNNLIVVLTNGKMVVYNLEDGRPYIDHSLELQKDYCTDTVSFLTVSQCGKYLVIGDVSSNVVVFSYTKEYYSFLLKLPRYQLPITAVAVNSSTSCLFVAYSDLKVLEYDLKLREITSFSKKLECNMQNGNWKTRTHPIRSITFDPRNKNIVLLQDDSNIVVINKDKRGAKDKPKSKVAKTGPNSLVNGFSDSGQFSVNSLQKYKHLVHIAFISQDELVAVEVNPLTILEKLPPAFAQKTFGSK